MVDIQSATVEIRRGTKIEKEEEEKEEEEEETGQKYNVRICYACRAAIIIRLIERQNVERLQWCWRTGKVVHTKPAQKSRLNVKVLSLDLNTANEQLSTTRMWANA